MPRGKEPSTGRIIPGPIAEMPYRLLRDTRVGAGAKIIYLALRHNARPVDIAPAGTVLVAMINRTYLLEDTGLGRETFRRGLAELEQKGWVAVVRPNQDEITLVLNDLDLTIRVDHREPDRNPEHAPIKPPSTYVLLAEWGGARNCAPP